MSFMQKFSKAIDKAGKQTSKAIVKGKIMAIQKIAHAEATPEEPAIVGALERLKATKNEISSMADVARYLYDSRINQANYQVDISHRMRDSRTAEEDGWSKLCIAMGNSMSRLESIHSEHCEKMKEEFVVPLEKFRDVDIAEVQKLKLKYKEAKSAYDVAVAKDKAAKESGQAAKMQQAFAKKQETEGILKRMRQEFLKAVEGLERQKNTELLGLVLDYWNHYVSFAKAQNNALQATPLPDDIDPTNYVGGRFQATTPGGDGDGPDGGDEIPETNFNEYPGANANGQQEEKDTTTNDNNSGAVDASNAFAAMSNSDYTNTSNNDYSNNGGSGEADGNVQGSSNPFDDDAGGASQRQGGGGNEDSNNNAFSNPTDDYTNNSNDYMNGNNNNNNDYTNNNDYMNGNDNNNNGGGGGDTNPFNTGNDDYTNNNNNMNNGGGGDPMDFDPYDTTNNQNYGQNQNNVGQGQSIASSQGGFL